MEAYELVREAKEQGYTEKELIEFVHMAMLGAKTKAYRLYHLIGKEHKPSHMYRLKQALDALDSTSSFLDVLEDVAEHDGTAWRHGNYDGHGECQKCFSHAHLFVIHKHNFDIHHEWEDNLWDGKEWGTATPDNHAALCKKCYLKIMPAEGWCECGCGI